MPRGLPWLFKLPLPKPGKSLCLHPGVLSLPPKTRKSHLYPLPSNCLSPSLLTPHLQVYFGLCFQKVEFVVAEKAWHWVARAGSDLITSQLYPGSREQTENKAKGLARCLSGKGTDCSSRGPEFKSQQPHGGSQPSVMRSDALFWCV